MRLDLFSRGDSVLLLGEGNFSFSVCLHKHNLPIKITATCFESEVQLEYKRKNIEYLKSKEVPVFLNVDATKLSENVNFLSKKFSKIVFNFPHVGGKMKIHLNRQLLRRVFESCSKCVEEDGAMIISLGQGQGGTPSERIQRRWEDSWQVTEMAAHGNFVLTAVEPFLIENFKEYKCIGYRSQDVKFNLGGALVHVFAKREPPRTSMSEDALLRRLRLLSFFPENSAELATVICDELYEKNPLFNQHSAIRFLMDFIVGYFQSEWRILNESQIPKVGRGKGNWEEMHSTKPSLSFSPLDTLRAMMRISAESYLRNKLTLYPGMYFNSDLGDFLKSSPITFQFIILGEGLLTIIKQLLNGLIDSFGERDSTCVSECPDTGSVNLMIKNSETGNSFVAARVYSLEYEGAVVSAQKICEHFFRVGWREIWSDGSKVQTAGRPTLSQILLHPSSYRFDLTLRYTEAYEESKLLRILCLAAGQLVEGVETVSEYTSKENWSSKCYRITYRSIDRPLHRKRAIEIHSKIVGRMLELGLNVVLG